ncbi:MAG: hypothetical protein ACLSDQ_10430 [Adlercreutzia equolifaciens]
MTRWRVTEKLESHHGYETAYELYDRLLERSGPDSLLGAAQRRGQAPYEPHHRQHAGGRPERALARKEADDVLKASLAARERADALPRKSAPWKRPPLPRQPVRCRRRRPSLDAAC